MNAPCVDITDILARKSEGRVALQKLTMAEKIVRMEALRERLRPLKAARQARQSSASISFELLPAGI